MNNQNERLWGGAYYIQTPGRPPANDYNTGCHSDQLLGQWWAHMLDLGYLYPPERVHRALESINTHNFLEHFAGFEQRPRRYIPDDEGGLLICTWPNGGRPDPFTIYADEVWTGIEYATAGLMIYEGMIDEARRIVRTARGRYDGRVREGLNSGPGGNPFDELECGKFYARAMSSWGLLIACQGLVMDGPAGLIGFRPRWQPEDHRSFFTAPEGWGLFVQERTGKMQTDEIQVRYGKVSVQEIELEIGDLTPTRAEVSVDGRTLKATLTTGKGSGRIKLVSPVVVEEGSAIRVALA
jgi:non-lysosomal glucosylceramidase